MSRWLGIALATVLGLVAVEAYAAPLKVGNKAPDFVLPDQNGGMVRLRDFLGKKNVVLLFYGQAFSDDFAKDLRAYQASLAEFAKADTQVLGISVENVYVNEAFGTELGVTFPLLSDYQLHFDKTVSKEYGVLPEGQRFPTRTTLVIDKQGIVRFVEGDVDPGRVLRLCSRLQRTRK